MITEQWTLNMESMILVYTHKVTPRIRYIFKHILTRTLLIPVGFTTTVAEFVAHNGPKFSYTKTPLGKEFFIKSNDLDKVTGCVRGALPPFGSLFGIKTYIDKSFLT